MSNVRLEFELIETALVDGSRGIAERAACPGGWLVGMPGAAVWAFVPDPGHTWGEQEPVDEVVEPPVFDEVRQQRLERLWLDLSGDQQRAVELRRDAARWRALVRACSLQYGGHPPAFGFAPRQSRLSAGADLTRFADRLLAEQETTAPTANEQSEG